MKRSFCPHAESAPPPKKRKLSHNEAPITESSVSPEEPSHGRFKPGQIVYEDDDFQFEFLYNDQQEDHLIALCDLKQIFAACLPRMGTRYVTRHVFDEHHRLICCRSKTSNTNKNNNNNIDSQMNYPVLYPVIGGICIRPFYEQHFGEVVFLAVHNQHQHKSVGRKIMRVMKHVAIMEDLHHFYTYADNQAIGFFQKMGFVKKKTSAHLQNKHQFTNNNSGAHKKEVFWDYIKHYTGSELMECKLHCKVDYIHLDENLRKIEKEILLECDNQRKAQYGDDLEKIYDANTAFLIPINKLIVILDLDDNFDNDHDDDLLILTLDKYGIMNDRDLYDVFKTKRLNNKKVNLKTILNETFGVKRGDEIYDKFVHYLTKPNDKLVLNHIDVLDCIDGVKEEWEKNMNHNDDNNKWRDDLNKRRSSRFLPIRVKATWILKRLIKNDDAYPFAAPVPRDVDGYYERIKNPMDLQTMAEKNDRGKYVEWKQFDHDFKLMISNCKEFNEPGSDIVKMCIRLDEYYMQCSIRYDRTMTEKKSVRK